MTDLPVAIDGDNDRGSPTAAEIDQRVAVVVKMLLEGSRRSQLIAHGATEWGVSSRTIDRYIAAARQQLRSDWEIDRTDMLCDLFTRLDTLERQARKAGAYAVSLGAINSLARIAQVIPKLGSH